MNGIEKITSKILNDAQVEADKIIAAADEDAKNIIAKKKLEANFAAEIIIDSAKQVAESQALINAGTAAMEQKKLILKAKQDMITKAFELAKQKLAALPKAEFIEILTSMAQNAIYSNGEILLCEELRNNIGNDLLLNINNVIAAKGLSVTISNENARVNDGFIYKNGSVFTNCTITQLIEKNKHGVTPKVIEILFKGL